MIALVLGFLKVSSWSCEPLPPNTASSRPGLAVFRADAIAVKAHQASVITRRHDGDAGVRSGMGASDITMMGI